MRCKGYTPAFQGLFKEEVKMQSDIFEEGEKTDKQILREMRKGWVRTLVSQDRPEYIVKLVEDALKEMSKADAAEYS